MSSIGRIKELTSKLFLTNISKGNISLHEYTEDKLLFLEVILSKELECRRINKIRYLKGKSGIKQEDYNKTLDLFNIAFTKNITKWHINRLKSVNFIKDKTNVIIMGQAGVGKTHLAIGTALTAIEQEIKTFYVTADDLVKIINDKENVKQNKKMEYIKSCDLVIIDEFGYIPLDTKDVISLYNIINNINNYTSIIVITNRDFVNWKDIFYDEVLASTILDRLLEKSFLIKIDSESYRIKDKNKTPDIDDTNAGEEDECKQSK